MRPYDYLVYVKVLIYKCNTNRVVMIGFLDDIRNSENLIYNRRNIINTIAVLFFRIAVVTFLNI